MHGDRENGYQPPQCGDSLDWKRLIGACCRGNERAWAQFYAYFMPRVRRIMLQRSIDPDKAEDLSHDVLTKLLRNDKRALQKFDFALETEFPAYVYVIAVRTRSDYLRNRGGTEQTHCIDLDSLEEVLGHPGFTDTRLIRRAIDDAVALLPRGQRCVMELRLKGLTSRQIADVLGLTKGGMDKVLFDARATLRRTLRNSWADTRPPDDNGPADDAFGAKASRPRGSDGSRGDRTEVRSSEVQNGSASD